MTPASLHSLKTLLDHAERERDAAQTALRAAEELRARAEGQAGQLHDYRDQYRSRWQEQFRQATTPAMLQCHHGFAQRLDQAIEQQQIQCRQATQRAERARLALQQREQRVAAVRKLIERRLALQRGQAAQREQKQTDEAAQRAAWRDRQAAQAH